MEKYRQIQTNYLEKKEQRSCGNCAMRSGPQEHGLKTVWNPSLYHYKRKGLLKIAVITAPSG